MNNSSFWALYEKVAPIIQKLKEHKALSYLVGGSVRDIAMGLDVKDFDIEVHNITPEKLESILSSFGPVSLIGKKFGVFKLHGLDADWALPRQDSIGRKPTVTINPNMTIEQACKRRDVTMNAMAINLNDITHITGENTSPICIIDPYNGLNDIKNRQLRAVDITLFTQDPLRFFRVMQFIGRFEMYPDQQLNMLCSTMSLWDTNLDVALARERIFEEIKKLFLKSRRPSLGFRWLLDIGRLEEIFPEIFALVAIPQKEKYHPEGSVFEHTMQALDASAKFTDIFGDEKVLIMFAVLCHDFGKVTATDENLSCHGHEETGIEPTKKFLKRLTDNCFLLTAVCKLVLHHRAPGSFIADKASAKAYKRLAAKLAMEVSIRQLALVALADVQGRNGNGHEPLDAYYDEFQYFLQQAEQANVTHKPEQAVLLGRDLLDVIKPGPEMGTLLKEAYLIQIEEGLLDVQELKKRVLRSKN